MENLILSAISNPVRLKMLCCLSKGKMQAGELVGKCGLAQSAVSQHLTKLKAAGLVKDERRGKFIYYSIENLRAAKIAKSLFEFCDRDNSIQL